MKVLSYEGSPIKVEFYKEGYYRLTEDVKVEVITDEGTLKYKLFKGFVTDLRSGSNAINKIIPKFTGNNRYNIAIIVHDFNYTRMKSGSPPVSKGVADTLLSEMTRVSGTLSSFQRTLMIAALKVFGGFAYDGTNKKPYDGIEQFMEFEWAAK